MRRTNQDAFIERSEIGVWAVADGMGGHDHGEIASRMICDALAALVPGATLKATVEAISQQLGRINDYLFRGGAWRDQTFAERQHGGRIRDAGCALCSAVGG